MKANDAGTRSSATRDPSCLPKCLHPHSGREPENVKRLASTSDDFHIVENEDDILECIGICSDNPQFFEEARQCSNGKTSTLEINVYNTLRDKL